jgi:hypothetical protein
MCISERGVVWLGCLGFSVMCYIVLFHAGKWVWITVVR